LELALLKILGSLKYCVLDMQNRLVFILEIVVLDKRQFLFQK